MSEKNTSSSTKESGISQPTADESSMEQAPLFTGACFCKAITFTLSSLPLKSYICHCLDCRRLTGTSFAHNIAFPFPSLTVSTRPSAKQSTDNSSASPNTNDALSTFGNPESGRRQFCGLCGTGLFLFKKLSPGEECEVVIVQAGAIDGSHDDERLRPVEEGFCKRRESWMLDMQEMKAFEEWRA